MGPPPLAEAPSSSPPAILGQQGAEERVGAAESGREPHKANPIRPESLTPRPFPHTGV